MSPSSDLEEAAGCLDRFKGTALFAEDEPASVLGVSLENESTAGQCSQSVKGA
jgi:hypothetical protein